MSAPAPARPPAPDQGRALLETAGKTVLLVRLVALLLTTVATTGQATPLALAGVLVLVALNAVLLLRWSHLVPVVRRHPGLLALDVVVSLAALALPGSNAQLLCGAAGALLIGMVMPRAGAVLLTTLPAAGQLLVAVGPAGVQAPVGVVADAALVPLLPMTARHGAGPPTAVPTAAWVHGPTRRWVGKGPGRGPGGVRGPWLPRPPAG